MLNRDCMKIHHIGYVTKNIYSCSKLANLLGFEIVTTHFFDDVQMNTLLIMQQKGQGLLLELIDNSHIESTIHNAEEGFHHLCFESPSYEKTCEMFLENKLGKIFTKKIYAPVFGREVFFAMTKDQVILEFIL